MKYLFWQEEHPTIHGGAENWLFDTIAGLRSRGNEVEWLKTGEIKQMADGFKPDVVVMGHIHCFIGIQHAETLLSLGIPSCWFIHDYWPFCGSRMLMQDDNHSDLGCEAANGGKCTMCRPQHQYIQDLVNKFFSITGCDGTADILRKNNINIKAVVEEGINTDLFPAEANKINERVVYAHAAGDEVWKGAHILRQAMQDTDVEVRFLTGLSRDEVSRRLQGAAVYSFPSVYQEIWGLALTEAMCSGCAVVASDVTGSRAQVHPGMGLLVPPRDPVALRDAVLYLLSNVKVQREFGERAREHVLQDHGLSAIGERWEKTLSSIHHTS